MKLYYISQDVNGGYDTYDAAVVAAETEEEAKKIHPGSPARWDRGNWARSPDEVTAEYLGEAKPGTTPGVILASYHAG